LSQNPHTFYRIDLVRVALQQRGASVAEINLILHQLNKAVDPAEFAKWNQRLDDKGVKVLAMMLTPEGNPLVDHCLQTFVSEFMRQRHILPEEIEEYFRRIGLN
jgi:hypothetical protein